MSQHPDGGMYSIKLVSPAHFDDVRFTPDTANDGRPRLMNFSDQGRTPAIAASISPGHRALVYVTHPVQKLVWAIEYTGTIQDGQKAAAAWPVPGHPALSQWEKIFIPIHFLATIDPDSAPYAEAVFHQAGVAFTPNVFSMKHISADEYQRIFDTIQWQWLAPTEPDAVNYPAKSS
jgi:hypothetical protein